MAFGAGVAAAARLPLAVRLAAVGPGAWLLLAAHGAIPGEPWVRVHVFVTIVVGGALVAHVDRRTARLGLGAPPVRDLGRRRLRHRARHRAGARAPRRGGARRPARLAPGASGAGARRVSAAVAVLAWTAAVGGVGRPSSIVGAVGCLGLFVVAPLSRRSVRTSAPVVVATHALLVLVASGCRPRPTVSAAVAVVLLELVVGVAVWGRRLASVGSRS